MYAEEYGFGDVVGEEEREASVNHSSLSRRESRSKRPLI